MGSGHFVIIVTTSGLTKSQEGNGRIAGVSGRKSAANVALQAVVGAEGLGRLARAEGDRFGGRDEGAAGEAADHLGTVAGRIRNNDLAKGPHIAHRPEKEMAQPRDRLQDKDDPREEEENGQAAKDEVHSDSRRTGGEVGAGHGVGGFSEGP